mmetsp:Transcript_29047/g.56817  ORF Transcript_29047/g.56817 Transcript_29047/m.56817 type:complete len:336 (+) Transcript_29047:71-1078(+)
MAAHGDLSGPLLRVTDAPTVRVWEPRRRSILIVAGCLAVAVCVCATRLQTESQKMPPVFTALAEEHGANQQLVALLTKASTIEWNAPNIFLMVIIAMCVSLFGMVWISSETVMAQNPELRSLIPVCFERQFSAVGIMMAAGMFVAILTGGWRPFCQLNWIALMGPVYAHYAINDKKTMIINLVIVLLYLYFGFLYNDPAQGVLPRVSQIDWIAPNIFLVILLPIYAVTVSILLFDPEKLFGNLMLPEMQAELKAMQNSKEFAIIWGCNLLSAGFGTVTALLTGGWELHCQLHLIGLLMTNWADKQSGNMKKAKMDFFCFTLIYVFFAFIYKIAFP